MKFPPIPTGQLTIGLNGLVMDTVFKQFTEKYLPAYEVEITSSYRTPDENEAAQGTDYSAHMYNLARDFALKDNNGKFLSPQQQEQVYKEFIEPNWTGYSYYNPPKTGTTGWVHLNLDRWITDKTKLAEMAVVGITVGMGIKKIIGTLTKNKGGKS